MRRAAVTAGVLALAAAGSGWWEPSSNAQAPTGTAERSATATCEDAALGEADPKWRKRSTVAGSFGFYGSGRNFKKWAFEKTNGFFGSKVPAIVEGSTPVTVRISERDVARAGMIFGRGAGPTVSKSLAEIRFEPCLNRSPTGWPGGFVLKNRKAVKFLVQVEGEATWTTISVGKSKRR